MEKRFIDVKELCEYTSISEETIRWWIYTRQISYRKIGKLIRFDLKEIDAFLDEKKVEKIH